ncbi:unnamed protein product, partial [Symbiodinium microadriaticum]
MQPAGRLRCDESMEDLVRIVEKHQDVRPTDAWLTTWSKNHRVNKGTKSKRLSAYKWFEADWRQLERQIGSTELLEDAPDALKAAGMQFQADATVVVFCNPRLVQKTLERRANKEHIKLCCDGTFHLVRDEWVLLTVGALSKHYAPASGVYAFRGTFNPLAFALANKENEQTYKFFFERLVQCAQQFAEVNLVDAWHQYHADLHAGENLAMKVVFLRTDRLADWAHVAGASVRPRTRQPPHDPEGKIAEYRAGIFKTMKKALSIRGQVFLPLIERACSSLRTMPTALLFHALAQSLLQTLEAQEPAERKAANGLRRPYFQGWDRTSAHDRFGIDEWADGRRCSQIGGAASSVSSP